MPTYRTRPASVEAMQLPLEKDQEAVRKVAEWLIDQGYREAVSPDEVYPHEVYDGAVLPEHGTNFLTYVDDEAEEHTASLGDYIIWNPNNNEVRHLSAENFASTYFVED